MSKIPNKGVNAMHDRIFKTCAAEFEKYVKGLFQNPRMLTKMSAEVPVIGGVFAPDLLDQQPFLLPRVCRALIAREQFHQDAPGWPTLPLRSEDCEELENADCP